ncbi:MAG: DNA polymerase Y family protein [Aggregatilineales bacterium]
MIVCLLLPYFAATLARRERDIPPDVPLILRTGEKVAATCEAATSRGVAFGMTVRQASWLCPDAQVIPINYQAVRLNTDALVQALSRFTHLIEADRAPVKAKTRTNPFPDARQSAVFYVDLERLAADETAQLAQAIGSSVRQAAGFEAACGLASTKFPAYAAAAQAEPGHLRVVKPREAAAILAPLPIWLLPMKKETGRRLLLLGIETLGAFASLPASAAAAQCGKEGVLLNQLARGIDPRPLIPAVLQVVERVTREFELPVSDRQVIEAIVRSMAKELSARLQASGCMGKTLVLHLSLDGGESLHEKTTLRQSVSSGRYLTEALLRLLARADIPSGICGLVVTLADLVNFSGQQLELFPDQPKPRERLQQRLASILSRPDAPDCFWITGQDPTARRIEHRYALERVVPL